MLSARACLASQTSRATDDIGLQIAQVQADTRDAAQAIDGIAHVIRDVTNTFTTIAAAIEPQEAATHAIAGNVQQAAHGTREVTETIGDVSQGAGATGAAASEVMDPRPPSRSRPNGWARKWAGSSPG